VNTAKAWCRFLWKWSKSSGACLMWWNGDFIPKW
jgi:hypothetical protein